MEFHQKLQELRKQRSMTQEELAEVLFVSRTAVSKWESGRGYPNLDSLQAIAAFFSVSVDQLLSCDEILTAAKEENQHEKNSLRVLIFGLLDVSIALFFFLPFFGQTVNGSVQNVSLGALHAIHTPLQIIYITAVAACVLWGLLTLTLQGLSNQTWRRLASCLSLGLNAATVLLFIISPQPYAAALLFVFLILKTLLMIKRP